MSLRLFLSILFVTVLCAGVTRAQMEDGDRGILPRDTAQVLEVDGVEVDVTGETPQEARFNGWREAQRLGWAKLWAETTGRPRSEAPELADSVLDGLVTAVVVEREQIGPTRYIASLGIQFDRARTGQRLGLSGGRRRSAPMLLVPVLVTGGTVTSVETRNEWQRAWAQLRTGDSSVDYVRVSGLGVDPLLVNDAVTRRPGAEWWTNVVDLYGAANVLVAEVTVKRLYPGGPAEGRFVARIGRGRDSIGSFRLRVQDSSGIPAMMRQGAERIDDLYQQAFEAGLIGTDEDLVIEEAPPPVPEEEEAVQEEREIAPSSYQLRVFVQSTEQFDQALGAVRAVPGVMSVSPLSTAIGGISNVLVSYRGDVAALRNALAQRGWYSTYVGGVLQIQRQEITNPAPTPPQPPSAPPPPPPPQGE
ncbi:heavy-metal-associated domain-containing protein [Sphingomicrobium sp. XHP0239]|uniref:heavy-metal-associated domain-containing protein n=1 Tax=Sphingomicrobium maritimum TaxID=3133972 RepID=UPI0031CCC6AE